MIACGIQRILSVAPVITQQFQECDEVMNRKKQASYRQSLQRGFTLIEAFIAVTILGVLGGIAINVYYDYVVRVKVAESAAVVSPILTSISVGVSMNGVLPSALTDVDYVSHVSTAYAGDYVSSVNIISEGTIRVKLKTRDDLRTASGEIVTFTTPWTSGSSALSWTIGGTVPSKYLPDVAH